MRQCRDCTWRFEDELTACPECGSQRSFRIAGTSKTTRPATKAVPAPAPQQPAAAPAFAAAAVPAAAPAGGIALPAAPDYDGGWFESGIHVAGLALVGTALAYLAGIAFLAGGTMPLGRTLLLLVAGALCFVHSPWGIKAAKTGCYGGILLDLRMLLFTLLGEGFGRYAIIELVHLAMISICLYLLHHDGAPNLKPWIRSLAVTCGLYAVMLIVCATGARREVDSEERQSRDAYAHDVLADGPQPARTFLAPADRHLNGLDHDASLRLIGTLEKAGAKDLQVAQVEEDAAAMLVMRYPAQQERRAGLRAAVATANHDTEQEEDVGEEFAVVECYGSGTGMGRKTADDDDKEE